MKTRADIAYYLERVRQSYASANSAQNVCARDSHRELAKAYAEVVRTLRFKQKASAIAPSIAAHRS